MLGFEDHGILTCMIHVDMGGTHQGFGGYSLGKTYTDYTIRELLKAVGVGSWEKLRGTYIRVKRSGGKITMIGNIIEDKWFDPVIK